MNEMPQQKLQINICLIWNSDYILPGVKFILLTSGWNDDPHTVYFSLKNYIFNLARTITQNMT